jgi:hypothetical protein
MHININCQVIETAFKLYHCYEQTADKRHKLRKNETSEKSIIFLTFNLHKLNCKIEN